MKHLLQLLTLVGVTFIASCGNQPPATVDPGATFNTDLLIPPTTKALDAQTQKSLNTYDKLVS
jgi:predicted small lipoprotein YifL